MIVGWIRTSIEPRVRSTVTFIQDSHKLWENLRKRFSVGNKVRIHHLKEQLAVCRQEGQAVIDYFRCLSKLWEELDMYKPLPSCTCSAIAEFKKEIKEKKIHQFVMGLDQTRFGGMCQGIISSDSTLDIGEIYSKFFREEQRLNSIREHETQQNVVGFVAKKELRSTNGDQTTPHTDSGRRDRVTQCAHCGRSGHDKANCWQLVGFPDWWEDRANRGDRGSNRGGARGGRGRGAFPSDRKRSSGAKAHATTSNSSSFPEFTQEQWRGLSQLLSEKANSSSDKLSGKSKFGDLVLDTGASHHMTGEISFL